MHQEFFGSTQFDSFLAEKKTQKFQTSRVAPSDLYCSKGFGVPLAASCSTSGLEGEVDGMGGNKKDLGEACGFSKWCAAIMLVLLKLLDFYM